MKKTLITAFLSLLLLISCGDGITRENYPKLIVGKWQATSLGKKYQQFLITTPATFVFKEDKTYVQTFTENGKKRSFRGRYKMTYGGFVMNIDLYQKKPKEALLLGILTFTNEKEMMMILSNSRVSKRPGTSESEDAMVFKRVE